MKNTIRIVKSISDFSGSSPVEPRLSVGEICLVNDRKALYIGISNPPYYHEIADRDNIHELVDNLTNLDGVTIDRVMRKDETVDPIREWQEIFVKKVPNELTVNDKTINQTYSFDGEIPTVINFEYVDLISSQTITGEKSFNEINASNITTDNITINEDASIQGDLSVIGDITGNSVTASDFTTTTTKSNIILEDGNNNKFATEQQVYNTVKNLKTEKDDQLVDSIEYIEDRVGLRIKFADGTYTDDVHSAFIDKADRDTNGYLSKEDYSSIENRIEANTANISSLRGLAKRVIADEEDLQIAINYPNDGTYEDITQWREERNAEFKKVYLEKTKLENTTNADAELPEGATIIDIRVDPNDIHARRGHTWTFTNLGGTTANGNIWKDMGYDNVVKATSGDPDADNGLYGVVKGVNSSTDFGKVKVLENGSMEVIGWGTLFDREIDTFTYANENNEYKITITFKDKSIKAKTIILPEMKEIPDMDTGPTEGMISKDTFKKILEYYTKTDNVIKDLEDTIVIANTKEELLDINNESIGYERNKRKLYIKDSTLKELYPEIVTHNTIAEATTAEAGKENQLCFITDLERLAYKQENGSFKELYPEIVTHNTIAEATTAEAGKENQLCFITDLERLAYKQENGSFKELYPKIEVQTKLSNFILDNIQDNELCYTTENNHLYIKIGNKLEKIYGQTKYFGTSQEIKSIYSGTEKEIIKPYELMYALDTKHLYMREISPSADPILPNDNLIELYSKKIATGASHNINYGFSKTFLAKNTGIINNSGITGPLGGTTQSSLQEAINGAGEGTRFDLILNSLTIRFIWYGIISGPEEYEKFFITAKNDGDNRVIIHTSGNSWNNPKSTNPGDISVGVNGIGNTVSYAKKLGPNVLWSTIKNGNNLACEYEDLNIKVQFMDDDITVTKPVYNISVSSVNIVDNVNEKVTPQLNFNVNIYKQKMISNSSIQLVYDETDFNF